MPPKAKTSPKSSRSTPSPISPAKAKQILKDGKVQGKPLTQAQKGYFGAKAGAKPAKKGKK